MGKSTRKSRRSRSYDQVPSTEKTSPYDIHDGKGTRHVDSDLLSSPREFVPLDQLEPGHASPMRVVLTLMTTSVGPTAVVLPYAMLEGGFAMGIFMVVFVALITHLTRARLVELGVEQGIYSFQGLAKLAFGSSMGLLVALAQLGVSFGLVVGYLLVLFQDVPIVLGHWLKMDFDADGRPVVTPGTKVSPIFTLLADRHWFGEAVTLLVLVPYCLYANSYKRMRIAPTIVCASVGVAAYSAIVKAKADHAANVATESQGYDRDYVAVPSTVCQAFAIVTMSVLSQHHTFHTFYAMRDRCPTTYKRLSLFASLGSLALGLSLGVSGYVSFLGATKGDVLQNYDFAGSHLVLVFWTVLPYSVVACVAYEVIVSRHTLQFLCRRSTPVEEDKQDVLFASQNPAKQGGASDHLHYEADHSAWTSHLLTAVAIIVVAQVPIFAVHDIASVLALTGGLAGIVLCFILPAACQLKLSTPNSLCADYFAPCTSIAIGVVGSIAAVLSIVIQARHNATPTDTSR